MTINNLRALVMGAALIMAGAAAQAAADILPGPGESGSCQNRNAQFVTQPDGQLTKFEWCAADASVTPGYAQRDRLERSANGGRFKFKNNLIFNCVSEYGIIFASVYPIAGQAGMDLVCPQ